MMIIAAFGAVYVKNLTSAVIAAGAISLAASLLYLLLAAPDVAMTEAAIGSGLTSVVFLYTLHLIKKIDEGDDD
ncbi:DUF4040 domain-containing protein [bacterium]|nr:DUF4040 domain-containing protein [bacterium]